MKQDLLCAESLRKNFQEICGQQEVENGGADDSRFSR